jgi:hypothetical protein
LCRIGDPPQRVWRPDSAAQSYSISRLPGPDIGTCAGSPTQKSKRPRPSGSKPERSPDCRLTVRVARINRTCSEVSGGIGRLLRIGGRTRLPWGVSPASRSHAALMSCDSSMDGRSDASAPAPRRAAPCAPLPLGSRAAASPSRTCAAEAAHFPPKSGRLTGIIRLRSAGSVRPTAGLRASWLCNYGGAHHHCGSLRDARVSGREVRTTRPARRGYPKHA